MQRLFNRWRAGLACLVALVAVTAGQSQVPAGKLRPLPAPARTARPFSLFGGAAGATVVALTGNRVQCSIWDFGNTCFNLYESGSVEGGFWPAGTPDNYVYNGGLQVGAIIPSNAGFGWAGDTVGVFFMDPRGDQRQGSTVSGVFDSRNANDLAVWPTAAYARDTSLFNQSLIGRQAISDQDTWVRYWDGNPALSTARRHMMGMVVDQRSMAWNRPFHQDMVYFIFRLINITSRLPASYAGLGAAGYSAADQQQLAALGAQFQDSARGREPTLQMPQGGFTFHNLYAAYFQDPDVGNAGFNFSTAVLPFSLVAAMKSQYSEPQWQFPLNIFGGAFAPAPGFEAIQFLRAPTDAGDGRTRIAVWANTCGGCGLLNDAVGVQQMYRYISGRPTPALNDGTCNSDPIQLHTCAALQAYADTRFFESTGPTDLGPGQSVVVAVAMVFAAPVAQWAATANGIYAMPAGQLTGYVNAAYQGAFVPGWPATGDTLALAGTAFGTRVCTTSCDKFATIREPVERAMGWGQFGDLNGDGRIEAGEVQTVPGSLLGKAQAAQALFDNKFLMPMAPAAPTFFLVPGDGQVTVAWQKSATDAVCVYCGDPYFAVASDVSSALYDPDYRKFDVEGYRIWRGTSTADLQVVAQFDYAGTSLVDYTGQVLDASYPQCAPELGLSGASCPVAFSYPYAGVGPSVNYDLGGDVVQVPFGGRVLLANGSVAVFQADTAVTGGGARHPPLVDNGVPFVFTDATVKNGFPYVYAVTAFDVNSIRSGPSSLESPLVTKTTTPRVSSGQEIAGSIDSLQLVGSGGRTVPAGVMPTLNRTTGIFSGPMPPTNGVGLGFLAFLPQVVGSDSMTLAIDSVVPADGWNGVSGTYYLTIHTPAGGTVQSALPFLVDLTNSLDSSGRTFPAVYAARSKAAAYGGDSTFALLGQMFLRSPGAWDLTSWGRGSANSYPYNNLGYNGPVWWDRTPNDTTPVPWSGKCHPSCANGPFTGSSGMTAGTLTGAQVMHIAAYETVQSSPMRQLEALLAYVARAADFKVYWGTAGAIDSVIDVTHQVPVPFNAKIRASWGILNDSSFTSTSAAATPDASNALLTWADVSCVDPAPAVFGWCTGTIPAFLMNHARLSPVAFLGSTIAGVPGLSATGNGFIFYIAGHFFVMQMAVLPARGTVWSLRTYAGSIGGTPGSFTFNAPLYGSGSRPPAVPGLRLRITFRGSVFNPKATNAAELAAVHTVPDPYYNHSGYETVGSPRQLRFVNLPAQCIIHIYSASGVLVTALTHNDPTGGGEEPWNVSNRDGQLVASGVYFYHVATPDGRSKVGRLTVVNITTN
jgi:hypothetical protein